MEPILDDPSISVPLSELRKRVGRSQAEVASVIGTTQSGVSRIERQNDIRVSTLADFVGALGGKLRVYADFDSVQVELAVAAPSLAGVEGDRHEYRVIWQDLDSRALVQVGWLEYTVEEFIFSYTDDARRHDRFTPFPSLPNMVETYRSPELFPFFALRLINTADPDYTMVVDSLGLSREQATPAELLARAPSDSPHDTIQVVPEPKELPDGSMEQVFLVSGVRHARNGEPSRVDSVLSGLQQGAVLELLAEVDNPADPRALQLASDGVILGWVPGYLVEEIHRYLESPRTLSFSVERANGPETPWHLRVLCRLHITG